MMRAPLPSVWSAGRLAGLAGFAAGGTWAAWQILRGPVVREFQAGDASPWAERAFALAQRATIESLGFGLLAALAACVAVLTIRPSTDGSASEGERFAARTLTVLGGVLLWVLAGTWLGAALLPLLQPLQLLMLDLAGITACVLGVGLLHVLVRRLPGGRGVSLPASALAGACVWPVAALLVQEQLFESGPRTAARWATAVGCFPAGWLAAVVLGRLLAAPVALVRLRMAAGSLLPAWASRPIAALFVASLAATGWRLELSALPTELAFAELEGGDVEGPNVVLVTVDTLRADHLGCYGYERPTSPFLDSLAAQGTRCADTSAPASWTKPSTATILTGLYPSRHGALNHGSRLQLPEGEQTLAEAFRDAGYVTAGFVTNPNVKAVFDFDRGFQEYFDSFVEDTVTLASIRGSAFGRMLMALTRHQFNWKYENDVRQMNRFITPWLAHNRDKRFFLYLHYIDPHTPYHPPAQYREEFLRDPGWTFHNERKRRVGIDLYDGEIRYTDDGLRELVAEMEQLGIWENTVFVLTSDHGEEFFEHGYDGHGFSLFQPVVGVPLLLHGPPVAAGHVVEEPVQVLDLPATLLDIAGVGTGRLGDGKSFAARLKPGSTTAPQAYHLENEFGMGHDDNRSFVFRGIREGRFKLVRTEANKYFPDEASVDGGLALYDLEGDPEERTNLIRNPEYQELVERLLRQLHSHGEFLATEGMHDAELAPMTQDLEDDLKALGYL